MARIGTYISTRAEDLTIKLYGDPFSDVGFDSKTGLYVIGDALASVPITIGPSDGREDQALAPSVTAPFQVEFDILAGPDSLDLPYLRRDRNGILAKYSLQEEMRRWVCDNIELMGHHHFSAVFRSYLLMWGIQTKILDNENNRRKVGIKVLDYYRSLGDPSLVEMLKAYEEKKMGEIVPLDLSASTP